MACQSIATHFLGASNTKPARIVAVSASGKRMIRSYQYDDSYRESLALAKELADQLEWTGKWIGGTTKEGYVFVVDTNDARDSFTVA